MTDWLEAFGTCGLGTAIAFALAHYWLGELPPPFDEWWQSWFGDPDD